ncbi:hypothetical protein [Bosea sp. (in: a-proteobacteria)]|jgi:hypothetical protein|uniref:hypothetical protein n=1 Tax=Bosea sp. (in: a-proteobacteria) TaxID=1871050 RepID=UPI002732BFD7|nr:hypothetical protein [Bosea sp. (in: a-proteobacteria)]MDP3407884.1 hypothetical protein [Bosea sp. (in: a-proteobacteria)]
MGYNASLNGRIVAWLLQRPLGVRHGNGECWTLAEDALLAQGARGSRQLTPHFSAGSDYIWGDEEPQPTAIAPGDILQLRNYSVRKTDRVIDFLSGPAGRLRVPHVLRLPHHTALVLRVVVPGALLDVIEQNVPLPGSTRPDRVVQINRLALASCQGPRESRLSDAGDRETTTTSYTVLGGRIRAFHPQR